MGPVQLPLEVREEVWTLKEKILTSPLLAFPDFSKPFLLETDASKEGLGAILSQKQDDGRFHPVAFCSHSLTPAERNYHSSKLEFLALKWGIMEHFREYLAYAPFMVKTDNNPLTYVLTTPNLDTMGHHWVGALASFKFKLEYQKRSENRVADALSCISIRHDRRTMKSLMEGAVMGTLSRCEAQASNALRKEHKWLSEEACLQAMKLAPMHVVDWVESQDSDPMLAACKKWLRTCREVPSPKRDTLLCELLGPHMEGKGHMLFRVRNSLILDKDLLYLNVTPKGEVEGVTAFMVPTDQRRVTLNGIHRNAGHQGQARTLALTQERFWWPTLVEDCKVMIRGCLCCHAFEGAIPKAPLCPIRVYAPLELMHIDFMSIKTDMELNKPPGVKNVLVITDHFTQYAMAFVTKDQTTKTVARALYEWFITIFGVPAKLLSDRGANFTSRLVEELCSMFGIQKCHTTSYHAQCNGQVEHFYQTLFHMLGKLTKDKKAQWEKHLPEVLQAYNSTQLVVTGYSLHYLIFGRHLRLPINFYFPTWGAFEHSRHVPEYVDKIRCHFKEAYTEAHIQTNLEADRQKQNYDKATSTVQLVLGNAVLLKQDAFQGKRKMKDRWGDEEYEVVRQVTPDVPTYEVHDRSGNARVIH